MTKKHSLESFMVDIDKITSGKLDILSEYEHCDEEYKELLILAQLLTKADYSKETQDRELEDDDLDMVAGGVNLNGLLDQKGKK